MTEITAADLGQRPCMVVAHPDDETLWAGGLLARFKDLEWRVLCCSRPRRDPDRAQRFYFACETLETTRSRCAPTVEGEYGQPIPEVDMWLKLKFLRNDFDCIVTHGMLGEYGHNQHIQVHHAVLDAFPGRVLGFGWSREGPGKLSLTLADDELALKRAALDCYGDKAAALRARYYGQLGVPEKVETFDVYRP